MVLTENDIRHMVKECLDRLLDEDLDLLFGYMEDNEIDAYYVLNQFLSDKDDGIARYRWELIPKEPYWNALRGYMQYGEAFRTPDYLIDRWLEIIMKNVSVLEFMTELAGHTCNFPIDELNDALGTDFDGYENASEYLYDIGYYDWAVLPDGTDAISDYGLEPMFNILKELKEDSTKGEKLIMINRVMDVVHCRGNLTSAFIEGGKNTCDMISNS